ncbi:hypothetical protein ACTWPB_19855 [Nocardia sp. IBHARD005]|uniref:hypothetical protein n=1 Tax=Nocardia sp. IBHARD005 TaxID=3457765 RepID=UPI004057DC13
MPIESTTTLDRRMGFAGYRTAESVDPGTQCDEHVALYAAIAANDPDSAAEIA